MSGEIEVRVKGVGEVGEEGVIVMRAVPLSEGTGRWEAVFGMRGVLERSVEGKGRMEAAGGRSAGVCCNTMDRYGDMVYSRIRCCGVNVVLLQNGHELLLWELRQIQGKLNLNTTEAVTSEIKEIKVVESNMNIVPEHSEIRRQYPVNDIMNFSEDSSGEEAEVGRGKRFVRNGFGRMSTVSSKSVGSENFKVR